MHLWVLPAVMQHDLEKWRSALNAFDLCDYEIAIDHFKELGYLSKALYNIGVCHVAMGQTKEAVLYSIIHNNDGYFQIGSFERAVIADHLMAVSHFQIAHLLYMSGEYERASEKYDDVIQCMRGNAVLEYVQTGLEFSLYEAEVWFNQGLCRSKLGNHAGELQSFMHAHLQKRLVRHDIIDEAISNVHHDYMPFTPPGFKVYRPKRIPNLTGSSLLQSLTGLHTPLPSNLLSETQCGSRKVVAVTEGELRPDLYDFGTNKVMAGIGRLSIATSYTSTNLSDPRLQDYLLKLNITVPTSIRFMRGGQDKASELVSKIKVKLGYDKIKIKYRDSQGDWLGLVDDDDLQLALESSNHFGQILTLRIYN